MLPESWASARTHAMSRHRVVVTYTHLPHRAHTSSVTGADRATAWSPCPSGGGRRSKRPGART
eukprot:15201181-Alexandrium_andersonii.AAC.1